MMIGLALMLGWFLFQAHTDLRAKSQECTVSCRS